MKLLFKQRIFSWLDSYDIYDESQQVIYTVQGKLAWGHRLCIYDETNYEVGRIEEKVLTFLPTYLMYKDDQEIGTIKRGLRFLNPSFIWIVKGGKLMVISLSGIIPSKMNQVIKLQRYIKKYGIGQILMY